MKRIRSVGVLLVLVFTIPPSATAAEAPIEAPAKAAEHLELIAFSAASLKEVFEWMAKDFEVDHAGVHIALQLAGNQELGAEIENAINVDVLASRGLRAGDAW
jgi:ABC-type molybdate transport system substrate-binding protein